MACAVVISLHKVYQTRLSPPDHFLGFLVETPNLPRKGAMA